MSKLNLEKELKEFYRDSAKKPNMRAHLNVLK
jgi:hypothetical protein